MATANDPTRLDPAILRRPGRFERVLACRPPTPDLRLEYPRRLAEPVPDGRMLARIAAEMDDFSYAQVRETFILAGQLAFSEGRDDIGAEDLKPALALVRGEQRVVVSRGDDRNNGFELAGRLG